MTVLMRERVRHWLRQPSTVAGLMGTAAGLCALALHAPAAEWCPLLSGGVVGLIFPDDATRQAATTRALTDALEAVVQHRLAAELPTLAAEAEAAVAVDMPKAPIPVTAVGDPGTQPCG